MIRKEKNMNSKEIRELSKLSRAAFSRKYNIPLRTLEDWDNGKNNPPVYVMELLERAVREDAEGAYALILSTRGNEDVVAIGSKEEMQAQEELLRKECRAKDPDGAEMDCYILSETELKEREASRQRWETLTEDQKHDYVIVNGRKYVRAIYESNNQ